MYQRLLTIHELRKGVEETTYRGERVTFENFHPWRFFG